MGNEARPRVAMLLDNHYGPDRRVEYEARVLEEAGIAVTVIAWDRRPSAVAARDSGAREEGPATVRRVSVPAPPGGGWRSMLAMLRFSLRVWRERRTLLAGGDAVVAHDVYLLPLAWAINRLLGLPFGYDAHEEYDLMEAKRLPVWWRRLVTATETRLARRSSVIVVPGTSRQPRWTSAGFEPPLVLRNLGGRARKPSPEQPDWDVAYCGTLADVRRLDLLVEAARRRPDLRIAIAGDGRLEEELERRAGELPNLDYLGYTDGDALLARSRIVYYGLDSKHPYSARACPNTLYQALRLGRPLVFFCGGEMAEIAERYSVGIRCEPDVDSLLQSIDRIMERAPAWEFDAAWEALDPVRGTSDYAAAVARMVGRDDGAEARSAYAETMSPLAGSSR